MRRGASASALCLALITLPSTALAQAADDDYCDAIDLDNLNGFCAEISIAQALVNLPGEPGDGRDAVVFDADRFPRLTLQDETDFRNGIYSPWRTVVIGSTAGTPSTFEILGRSNTGLNQPLSLRLAVQNLFLENVIVTTPFSGGSDPQTPGQVTQVVVGDSLNAGVLRLNNSSFLPSNGTTVLLGGSLIAFGGSTDTPALIEVVAGDNVLRLPSTETNVSGVELNISADASLMFSGSLLSDERSNLIMASGSSLTVEDGVLRLVDQRDPNLRFVSTVSDAKLTVRAGGGGAALEIGDAEFSGSTIRIEDTLQVYRAQSSSAGTGGFGEASFDGINSVLLIGEDSIFSTSQNALGLSMGEIHVGQGTTNFSGEGRINTQAFRVDSGTLDVSALDFGAFFRQQSLVTLDIRNGGIFIDGSVGEYEALQTLSVDGGTLRIAQVLGDYDRRASLAEFLFNNAVIVPNFDLGPNRVGRSITFNAQLMRFTGANTIRLAFDPNGKCPAGLPDSCPSQFLRFNDTVSFNVGNSPTARFEGFANVTFLPVANGSYAPSEFVNGGNNGIYTISRVSTDPNLVDITLPDGTQLTPQGYDALPRIPTLGDLSASGSNLPANLSYVIINDPLEDDRIDIAFVERNLGNHPDLAAAYTAGETIRTVTEPETGNISTITVTITPETDGTAMETTNVVVTEPDGDIISTSSVTVELDQPKGTENTQAAGQLLSNSAKNGSSLPFISHQNIAQQITSFHPEPYSSFLTVGLEQLDLFRNMALDRAGSGGLSVNARESETQTRKRVWLDTSLVDGNVDGSGNLGNFDYELISFAIGIDLMSRQDARLGVFVGYGHQKMDEHDIAQQDFSADTYHVGAYGQYLSGQWDVRAALAYARGSNESERLTSLGNTTSTNRANFNSDSIYAGLKVQYDGFVDTEALSISPEVGLGYSYLRQEALVETGATQTALALESATAESIVTSAGLNVGLFPSAKIHPVGFVRYERDWYADNNRAHEIRARLATTPGQPAEVFIGQNRGPDALIAGIGLASSPSSGVQLGGGIVYANTSNGEELGGGFNLQVSF